MRLATLDDGSRDGALVVVSADGARSLSAAPVARSLQRALDAWDETAPRLLELAALADAGEGARFDPTRCRAPLPRAFEWIDGSAYISHIVLVRRARGADPPATLRTEPLVYQGGSGVLLGPHDPIVAPAPDLGLDYEAELCVVLDDTPMGTTADDAASHIKLLLLCNDVTLRSLVPGELAKGFGFLQSKPATAFAPLAVTPYELGGAFRDARAHLTVRSAVNGQTMGEVLSGPEMHFSFADLIAHVARTRALTAGTILGSGTVSNEDPARGVSCLAERRMREALEEGEARTPFLRSGDRVRIEAFDAAGRSVFGAIDQEVAA